MESKLRTLLIEHPHRATLSIPLARLNTAPIEIISVANSCEDGLRMLRESRPQLVMLEAELPDGSGFQLLEQTRDLKFDLVVCSDNAGNLVKATRFAASAFMLRPFGIADALDALRRVRLKRSADSLEKQFVRTFRRQTFGQVEWLAVPGRQEIHFLDKSHVLRVTHHGAGTLFHLATGKSFLSPRHFLKTRRLLSGNGFFSLRPGVLLNIHHIVEVSPGIPSRLVMSDDWEVACDLGKLNSYLSAREASENS